MKKACLLILSISFFLLKCTKKEEVKNEVYIISKEEQELKKRIKEGNIPPPPPFGFYGSSNIIIDKEGNLYFYQRTYYGILGCIVEDNPLPEFIDLQPKDLVKIPATAVGDFLKENTAKNIKEKSGGLIIASQLDTLDSKGFFNMMHFLNDYKKSQIAIYLIRRTTQEEDVVLQFKKNDSLYDADSIKWDRSRIKFFE